MIKRDEVIMRRRNGATHSQISKATGVPMSTLAHWLAKEGLSTPNVWTYEKLANYREVVALRGAGRSIARIAMVVGLSKSTVERWLTLTRPQCG